MRVQWCLFSVALSSAGCAADDADATTEDGAISTDADGTNTSDAPASESSGGGTEAGAESTISSAGTSNATDGESTAGEGASSTGEVPTGDVWVDAEQAVIGFYRVVVDDDGDAVEGLVQLDADITWEVADGGTELRAVDRFGSVYYESNDCSGPMLVAELPTFGSFRSGIVASANLLDFTELQFLVPDDVERVEAVVASTVYVGGCTEGLGSNLPPSFLQEADLQVVTPPDFATPLTLEHH